MKYAEPLRRLVRDARLGQSLDEALDAIGQAALDFLGVARVSAWRLESGSGIRCIRLRELGADPTPGGQFLAVAHCPSYFQAIEGARVLGVEDALRDPRTSGLAQGYLIPLGVGALLDAPIVVGGRLYGVLCHEHVGEPRPWSDNEKRFAASLGDLAALAVASEQRRLAQEALRSREQEMRFALQAAGVADWSYDRLSDEFRWSEDARAMLAERPPADLQGLLRVIGASEPSAVAHAAAAWESGEEITADLQVSHGGRETFLILRGRGRRDLGTLIGMTGVLIDVTPTREAERRLARTDRLKSLGLLSSAVAHDFNNNLTAIMSAAEFLQLGVEAEEEAELLEMILTGGENAARLTRRLLSFGGRVPTRPRPMDLSVSIGRTCDLLRRLLPRNILFDVKAVPGRWMVGDPGACEQLVMNLVLNARDAMPSGGRIRVELSEAEDGSRLVVEDDGPGIPDELRERVFEPYFTTRGDAGGTGLGLSIVRDAVESMGGLIKVDTGDLGGTRFTMELPSSEPSVEAGWRLDESPPARPQSVLVVDDDPAVRRLVVRGLRGDGHRVVSASSVAEAKACLGVESFDVVLCDQVLHDGSGTEVLAGLARLASTPDGVLVTGYEAPDPCAWAVLPKPFGVRELRRLVAETVAARTSG